MTRYVPGTIVTDLYNDRGVVICNEGGDVLVGYPDNHCSSFLQPACVSKVKGAERWTFVRKARRPHDNFMFRFVVSPDRKQYIIDAGCRFFMSFEDARDHWRYRVRSYGEGPSNDVLNKWSLQFVRDCYNDLRELRRKSKPTKKRRKASR